MPLFSLFSLFIFCLTTIVVVVAEEEKSVRLTTDNDDSDLFPTPPAFSTESPIAASSVESDENSYRNPSVSTHSTHHVQFHHLYNRHHNSPNKHHTRHQMLQNQQEQETTESKANSESGSSGIVVDPFLYRSLIATHKKHHKKVVLSHKRRHYADCTEVSRFSTDDDKFMSHSTKTEVKLAPGKHVRLTQCVGAEEKARCAVGSACATVYRWLPATVLLRTTNGKMDNDVDDEELNSDDNNNRTSTSSASFSAEQFNTRTTTKVLVERHDRVLLPAGCTCLGQISLWEQHMASISKGSTTGEDHKVVIYDDPLSTD